MTLYVPCLLYNINEERWGTASGCIHGGGIRMDEEDRMRKAEMLHLSGKTREAFPLFEKEAHEGNGRALYFLAEYYKWGMGGREIDWETAEELDRDGARCGEPLAQLNMIYYPDALPKERDYILKKIVPKVAALSADGDWAARDELADLYLNGTGVEKDVEKALYWAEKSAEAGYFRALTKIANIYHDQGKLKEAMKYYELAGKAGSDWGWHNLGEMYLDSTSHERDERKAESSFQKAIALDGPALPAAACSLGALYYQQGNFKKAAALYRKSAGRGNDWAMFNLGDLYRDGSGVRKNLKIAMKWYKKAYEADDEARPEAANRIGLVYSDEGDKETALLWYERSGAEGCDWGWYNLGLYYQDQEAYDAALSCFRKAYELNGDAAGDAANRAGLIYNGLDVDDKASEWYQKAGEAGNSWGWYNLGAILKTAGKAEEALTCFRKAYDVPDGPKGDAANRIALIYEDLGREEETEKWYRISGKAGYDWGWYNLGLTYLVKEKKKEALSCFDKACSLKGECEAEAANKAGIVCFSLGDMDKAMDWAMKSASEGSEWGLISLGTLYRSMKKYDKAVYWYEKAYKNHGEAGGDAALRLAEIYDELSQKEKALFWYRKAGMAGNDEGWYRLAEAIFHQTFSEETMRKAAFYYELAYEKGGPATGSAAAYRGLCSDRLEHYEEADYWFEKAIGAGNSMGLYLLAWNAWRGRGMKKNVEKAETYFQKVLESDLDRNFKGDAACMLGKIEQEKGNEKPAFIWYKKATGYNHDEGWYRLGLSYANGVGTGIDAEKALESYLKGWKLDHDYKGPIATAIGLLYNGKEDFKEAHEWFDKAASCGDDEGAFNLAAEFRYGIGTEKDLTAAENLYGQLAAHASENIAQKAAEALSEMKKDKNSG